MLLFYRSPSAPTHGASHGIALHFADPESEPSRRATRAAPLEQRLILMAGVLNGYVNAHGALVTLYGWDVSQFNLATTRAAQELSAALCHPNQILSSCICPASGGEGTRTLEPPDCQSEMTERCAYLRFCR